MKSFTDNTGRAWTLSVTVGTIKRVRALCNVDLVGVISIESGAQPKVDLLERLGSDPVLLVDVLYAVCKPEADAKGVSDEEFGQAMSGDAIEMATTALLDEVIDFSPKRNARFSERFWTQPGVSRTEAKKPCRHFWTIRRWTAKSMRLSNS